MGVRYIVTDQEFGESMTFRSLKATISDAEDCLLNNRGLVVMKETFEREDITDEIKRKLSKRTQQVTRGDENG